MRTDTKTTTQFCDSCEDLTTTTETVVDGDTLSLCANCI